MVKVLRETPERRWSKRALLLVLSLVTVCGSLTVSADERDQAKRMHDRIAGVPPDAATLDTMAADILGGNALTAALIATDNPAFYSVTLKNFAAPWTNRNHDVFVPLNDYTATVIGMVRDDVDFRNVLFGDIIYVGAGNGIPAYSNSNNANYDALEAQAVDLSDTSKLVQRTQSSTTGIPASATAGVITTRAASKAFFIDGTNRAMFRFTLLNHLCRDLEQVHDTSRAPDRIRQDVSRSPGGDARVFLNGCIGCHSGMDPMTQAFAYYNFQYDKTTDPTADAGFLTYNDTNDIDATTGTRVVRKYFNNNTTFPYGYITMNDHWDNYWRHGQNEVLGWDGGLPGSGDGAKSLGQELANSQAFAQCQVEKVFTNVCLRAPQDANDRSQVSSMVSDFQSDYNLRKVFAESAVYCMGN
jgi:hypothetical protein